jgi:hypothetical protein
VECAAGRAQSLAPGSHHQHASQSGVCCRRPYHWTHSTLSCAQTANRDSCLSMNISMPIIGNAAADGMMHPAGLLGSQQLPARPFGHSDSLLKKDCFHTRHYLCGRSSTSLTTRPAAVTTMGFLCLQEQPACPVSMHSPPLVLSCSSSLLRLANFWVHTQQCYCCCQAGHAMLAVDSESF